MDKHGTENKSISSQTNLRVLETCVFSSTFYMLVRHGC